MGYHKHFKQPDMRDTAIDLLCCFHPYVNYHIKCNKAHIHSRMRKKLAELLKIMNRAKFGGAKGGGKKKAERRAERRVVRRALHRRKRRRARVVPRRPLAGR